MQHSERSGLLLALTGFAILSLGDGMVKTMAGAWPALAVATLRFCIGAVVLSAVLLRSEGRGAFRPLLAPIQLARGACVAISSTCFFSAIYLMPLAETMALAFLAPVFTALLSGPLLGEKVRAPVWIASLMALGGVIIILRPNLAELGWPAFLPLASAFFFGLMIVFNRKIVGRASPLATQAYLAITAAPMLALMSLAGLASGIEPLQFGPPSWDIVARCAFVALTATSAHWLVYLGTTRAGAAQVAPCTNIQILMATMIGWLGFGEVPDLIAFAGAAIIIAAGLFLWRTSSGIKPAAKPVSEAI